MAFEAFESKDGENIVMPSEVSNGEDVYCLECLGRMRVISSYTDKNDRFVPRHFRIQNQDSSGEGGSHSNCVGEGDVHKRCKAITVATLNEFYPNATVKAEQKLRIYGQFDKRGRDGDIVATFKESHDRLGKGIVVEIQDAHEDKDVLEVTESYLSKGYSVVWLTPDDFGKRNLKYSDAEFELLAIGEHPDGDTVYDDVLNDDGTTPNKSVYPIVAPAVPHSFGVARDRYDRVTTGWHIPAYTSYDGCVTLNTEVQYSIYESTTAAKRYNSGPVVERRVSMPEQFYKDCTRKWFRETEWSDLFTEYEWDTKRIREEWGDECAIDELEVRYPLAKWCEQEQLFAVLGSISMVDGSERRMFTPGTVSRYENSDYEGVAIALEPWDEKSVSDYVEHLDAPWKLHDVFESRSFKDKKILAPRSLLEGLKDYRTKQMRERINDLPTEKVRSIIAHNSGNGTVSLRAIKTVGCSYADIDVDEFLEAVEHLVENGDVVEENNRFRVSD